MKTAGFLERRLLTRMSRCQKDSQEMIYGRTAFVLVDRAACHALPAKSGLQCELTELILECHKLLSRFERTGTDLRHQR